MYLRKIHPRNIILSLLSPNYTLLIFWAPKNYGYTIFFFKRSMFEKQQPDGLKSRWSYPILCQLSLIGGWAPSTDGFVVKNHGDCNSFPFQITCKWYKWPTKLGWSGLHLHVLGWILQVYHWNATPKHPESHGRGSALGDPSWILKKWSTSKSRAPYHPYLHEWFVFFYGKILV